MPRTPAPISFSSWLLVFTLLVVSREGLASQEETVVRDNLTASQLNPADHWVAEDALGRTLPVRSETTARRPEKLVGMFYYVWVGNHNRSVFDISDILKDPAEFRKWGPERSFHFWGKPEHGYYHAADPWVIRRDMQMLANAGVDFIFFDVTNRLTYTETVKRVLDVISEMRSEGNQAPQICFLTNAASGQTMNRVYDNIYGNGENQDLWFKWHGKPLIMGDATDPKLRPEVREFFTIKRSWAWTGADGWFGNGKDRWPWLDTYPQNYGWHENPSVPEQLTVSTANHPGGNEIGKSFHGGKQPHVDENYLTEFTNQGLQFAEQWQRAHEIDPQIVLVTQWNEWLAQRGKLDKALHQSWKGSYAGRPIAEGSPIFIDVWNREFNRDISPMQGGYTDNYYYQLISNIRRFKGMTNRIPRPSNRTITLDGDFEDWAQVENTHWDPTGDTEHRDFEGTDPNTRYVNSTGRNDIVHCKAVRDESHVYFLAEARRPLSPSTDANWMLLLIDTDQNKATGWEGYDLMINRSRSSNSMTTIEVWNKNRWVIESETEFLVTENRLELKVPVKFFGESPGGFDFKWADNPQHLRDMTAFFTDGDSAPDRRFNYRF